MRERNEIDNQYKWDLSQYCSSDEEYYERLENLKPYVEKIKVFEGKLENDDMLFQCWELDDEFEEECYKIMLYALCKEDEDQRDERANAMIQKIEKLTTEYNEASSYISPEISKFSKENLLALQENAKFKKFVPYIKEYIRQKEHVLSKEEENLISGMGEFLGSNKDLYRKFIDADLKFEDAVDSKGKHYPLSYSTFSEYLRSEDRELRKTAFINKHKRYGENINFLTSNYVASIKQRCFFAKKRGYKSALSASIYNEEASEKVYKKLIEKVRQNVDIVYRYFDIKAKLLGVEKFNIYDKFAPIGEEDRGKISYKKAINIIKEAVKPLGEKYISLVQKSYDEKWADVYPNEGKRSGAYSTCVYGGNPLVLLNFDEKMSYVSTIAHELGHAIHSYFSNKKQPFQTAEYVIFVAEVASTVNEMLLWRYNIKNYSDKKVKLKLYDELFEMVNSTIFRQTMFSEFEENIHVWAEQGEAITKDKLCSKYFELNKYYYGENVNLDKTLQYEWARIPHFYRAFYVYKYATGLICALNLSKKIAEGDKIAIDKYYNFLSSGSSADPITLLKWAGVDLEQDETFDEVFSWIRQMLDEWEKLI